MKYLILIPFMSREAFVAAMPDGLLEGWEATRSSVWLAVTVPTEADVVMARMVLPGGWNTAGVYAVHDDGQIERLDVSDERAALETNSRLSDAMGRMA